MRLSPTLRRDFTLIYAMHDTTYSARFVTGAKRMHQARRCVWSRHDNNVHGPCICDAASANCTHIQTHTRTSYTHTYRHADRQTHR